MENENKGFSWSDPKKAPSKFKDENHIASYSHPILVISGNQVIPAYAMRYNHDMMQAHIDKKKGDVVFVETANHSVIQNPEAWIYNSDLLATFKNPDAKKEKAPAKKAVAKKAAAQS